MGRVRPFVYRLPDKNKRVAYCRYHRWPHAIKRAVEAEAKLKAAEEALQEHCNACYRDALEPCLDECNVGIALDAIRRKGERV